MDDFINQDLMQGQDVLMLDLDRCTRCDECVKACVATHTDGITRLMRDGLRFQNYLVTTSCRACLDPLCMTHCPVGSIRRKGSTLDIVIEDWCTGCNACANDCPYGAINIVDMTQKLGHVTAANGSKPKPKAVVCDLCKEYPEPNCVRACPQDAAIRVQPNFFFARDLAGVQLAAMPKPKAAAAVVPDVLNETRIFTGMDLLSLTPRLKVVDATSGASDPLPAGHSRTFVLRIDGTTSFGRSVENNWVPDNTSVSGKHAVIECRNSRFVLRNLSQTNGTYVNNDLADPEVELHPGDLIEMGVIKFKFLVGRQQ
jgi:Fe-S-cluster-containing hydrogenase component 2